MAEEKYFITPNQLRLESYQLARKVWDSGFRPDLIVPIGRGGAPIAVDVHEFFRAKNCDVRYIPLGAGRYTLDDTPAALWMSGLHDLIGYATLDSKVLLVDDISDEGITIKEIMAAWREKAGIRMPKEVKIATLYFKPERNITGQLPHFYLHTTRQWIVFPHEARGLTRAEQQQHLGEEIRKILEE